VRSFRHVVDREGARASDKAAVLTAGAIVSGSSGTDGRPRGRGDRRQPRRHDYAVWERTSSRGFRSKGI